MGNFYRQVDEHGNVTYTDRPVPTQGEIEAVGRDGRRRPPSEAEAKKRHEETTQYIKQTQKWVPKLYEYYEYLQFLRDFDPLRFELLMKDLQKEDPETWLKLMEHPQFRPMHNTALGAKAAGNRAHYGVDIVVSQTVTGKYTGSVEKWFETTVQEMMKKQRYGGYADVLGDKATTLPTKTPEYSSSRLGQFQKLDDVRAAAAAKDARAAMDAANAARRTARGAAITRPGNTLVDIGVQLLNPEAASSLGIANLNRKAQKLFERGVLDVEQWAKAKQLLSQGRYVEMQKLMDDAVRDYVKGAPE
ncbi:DUF4124 domain-containing protein [Caldimonas brevitalea]|uniref:DUF4124 domain-containing protein n=1 Tax=Caldimonas brevitalea TaxID=413882 RepID=A0A0G3BMT0_9BURK|nr:DUF4124 domain-containing protein [Caldimonas brevitalea]AKJ30732.1 hypothetical protein AAW51_4041 [Caldimonas brevitalea]